MNFNTVYKSHNLYRSECGIKIGKSDYCHTYCITTEPPRKNTMILSYNLDPEKHHSFTACI